MNIQEYLNAPVPRRKALLAVGLVFSGTTVLYAAVIKHYEAQAKEIISDLDERIQVYRDTTGFLMEHASGSTLNELNEKLDYWRVIRGLPVQPEEDDES